MGEQTIPSSPSELLPLPPPVKAARTAGPSSMKMKSSVSGLLWNDQCGVGGRERGRLLEVGHLSETGGAPGAGNGKAARGADLSSCRAARAVTGATQPPGSAAMALRPLGCHRPWSGRWERELWGFKRGGSQEGGSLLSRGIWLLAGSSPRAI